MKKINWKRIRHEIAAAPARALLGIITAVQTLCRKDSTIEARRSAGSRLSVWLAGAFLAVMTLLAFCIPLRPVYSEQELRNLTEFPAPSASTVLDGAFFSDINTWFADTFPFREQYVQLSARIEQLHGFRSGGGVIHGDVEQGDEIPTVPAGDQSGGSSGGAGPEASSSGKTPPEVGSSSGETPPEVGSSSGETPPEVGSSSGDTPPETGSSSEAPPEIPDIDPDAKVETLGAVLIIDDAAYEYYNFKSDAAAHYIKVINRAASQLDGIANVYNMIVPNSMDICVPESIRSKINTSDQRKAIDYFYSSYDSGVTTVNAYDALLRHSVEGEYLYFRTDHHWTALGAYYAYLEFAKQAGFTAADLNTDFTEHIFDGFQGSFCRETNSTALKNNPDTVYAYEPVDTNDITIHWADGTESGYHIITDVSSWAATSKYSSTFIGGDNPYSVIENPNITDGSSIVLIKESYGNCFAPFLVESYQYVYVVDYRYYNDVESGTLTDLVKSKGIQDVLFLNTINTTRSDSLITLLDGFIG